ncbi:MAG: hypothetical protein HY052_06370 [Proteobacteria bacterium]|nr:hypothetical protein [Pseudomonadota bacterium]
MSAFEEADLLTAPARAYIADKLDKELSDEVKFFTAKKIPELRVQLEDWRSKKQSNSAQADKGIVDHCMKLGVVAQFVAKNKGDDACLFVKLYPDAMAKLSDAATSQDHIDVLCETLELVQKWPEMQAQRQAEMEKERASALAELVKQRSAKLHRLQPWKTALKRR